MEQSNKQLVIQEVGAYLVKLVEVIRSGMVESIHRGSIAAVDCNGRVLFEMGDIGHRTFFRSSAKPIIAVAAVETGIVEEYKLELNEIAIIASSHSGAREHIEVLKGIMTKIGIEEDVLICGATEPTGKEAARELQTEGGTPTKLHCNCSAKHMGVIAAAKIMGLPVKNYHNPDHVMQKRIVDVISDFTGVNVKEIEIGVDGCGIPVFRLPLKNMALAYANLCNPGFLDGKYLKSQNYVLSAMTMYPEMVAGEGRTDTIMMRNFGDRIVTKVGAEGVYCVGVPGKGVGIALKIDDGNSRAIPPAILETLLRMDIIKPEELDKVKDLWTPPVLNHKGDRVGEIRARFE